MIKLYPEPPFQLQILDGDYEIIYKISLGPIHCSDIKTKELVCIESILAPILIDEIDSIEKMDSDAIFKIDKEENVIICKYVIHDNTILV